jgi:hypothetical protein
MIGTAIKSAGANPITDWTTGIPYIINNYVQNSNILYKCISAHTSGTFNTDLIAGKWKEIYDQNFTIAMAIALG